MWKRVDQTLRYSKINVNHTSKSNTAGLGKEFFVPSVWGIILILVGITPKNMSPVCWALSLLGFALWLMPRVSPGSGGGGGGLQWQVHNAMICCARIEET